MKDRLSEIYADFITSSQELQESLDLVRRNSKGNIWVIGGAVYRTLINKLYGTASPLKDFDFIVEEVNEEILLPDEWKFSKNRYGNPKFIGREFPIDLVPLREILSIKRRNLDFTFQNYLTGTPLTVQSIGYDVSTEEVMGEIGIRAIEEKVVRINDMEQAKIFWEMQGKPIPKMIKEKAESLGFSYEL